VLLLTAKEAAAELRIHIDTLYEYVRRGLISYVPIGRKIMFRPEAIQEFLNKIEVRAR
jgi:excisionase family DNA binding protein